MILIVCTSKSVSKSYKIICRQDSYTSTDKKPQLQQQQKLENLIDSEMIKQARHNVCTVQLLRIYAK